MNLTFHPYQSVDRDQCIRIFRSNIPKFFLPHEESDFLNYLDQQVKNDYWCVETQSQLIGCGGIHVKPCGTARLVWGMIQNDLHKKGYGRALLQYRLRKLASLPDVKIVELDTTQHHPEFFKKFGFKDLRVTKNKYGPQLHSHEMSIDLTPQIRSLWQHFPEYSA